MPAKSNSSFTPTSPSTSLTITPKVLKHWLGIKMNCLQLLPCRLILQALPTVYMWLPFLVPVLAREGHLRNNGLASWTECILWVSLILNRGLRVLSIKLLALVPGFKRSLLSLVVSPHGGSCRVQAFLLFRFSFCQVPLSFCPSSINALMAE